MSINKITMEEYMPSKHIDNFIWKQVQEEHVKAVILTKASIKDTDVLKLLIKKGLETISKDDYLQFLNKKN